MSSRRGTAGGERSFSVSHATPFTRGDLSKFTKK